MDGSKSFDKTGAIMNQKQSQNKVKIEENWVKK